MATSVTVPQSSSSVRDAADSNSRTRSSRTNSPQVSSVAPKKQLDWELFWKHVKFWSWSILTKLCVTIVYFTLVAQGLRLVLPEIGMRLSKLPGLSFLDDYTATYRLDLAHVFAAVPLVSAWILWHWNLEMYLRPDAFDRKFRRWNLDRIKRVIITMGAIVIAGDACLFGAAFMLSSWGGPKFSAAAVLATLVYVTVLAFVTFVSLCLGEAIDAHKKENQSDVSS